MLRNFAILFFCTLPFCLFSQKINISTYEIIEGDTIINYKNFPEIEIISFQNRNDKIIYLRTKKRLKKVYPIALFAKKKIIDIERSLDSIPKKRKKRKFKKELGKWVKNEYEPIFRKMSIKEGRILIKMIHRETNFTTYDLIREYRGIFSAFFWQRIIKAYNNDLKMIYDPILNEEDKMIEVILNELKNEGNFVSK